MKMHIKESDKEILKRVYPKYQWLARDKNGVLYAYENKPEKDEPLEVWFTRDDNSMFMFSSVVLPDLFQWSKWEDEPLHIADLLEGEEKL